MKSRRVGFVDETVQKLVDDMIETTVDWDKESEFGAAIAAIQVGEPLRLTVVRNNFEDAEDTSFLTFINPEIVQKSSERVIDIEGCLSVPGYYARVPRAKRIKVKAQTLDGSIVRLTLEGFAARVFQHEIDHMHGKLFIDYVHDAGELLKIAPDGQLEPIDKIPKEILDAQHYH